jgi:hypothetical protein
VPVERAGARVAVATRAEFASLSLIAGRAHQRDGGAMANKLGEFREFPVPQREHVVVAAQDDGLPLSVIEGLLSNDEVARRDLIPVSRQAAGGR